MEQKEIVNSCMNFVRQKFENEPTGHDWFHIERVFKLSEYIAQKEICNLFEVQLTALFHDVADWKFSADSDAETAQIVNQQLKAFNLPQNQIDRIIENISQISFKGAGVHTNPKSIEAKIVQDADRLEAIGAIGIARTFAYGGNKNRQIYNPEEKPVAHQSFEEYKKNTGSTINHFYEKLLLLKDKMNTPTARKIAEERHAYMEAFLQQFYKEWNVMLEDI